MPTRQRLERVVIVGAGHAGGTAAVLLRQRGFNGEIVLVSQEEVLPYERPPLTKRMLLADLEEPLFPSGFFLEHGIDLLLDRQAIRLERSRRNVHLKDGASLRYDHLILATGARARAR